VSPTRTVSARARVRIVPVLVKQLEKSASLKDLAKFAGLSRIHRCLSRALTESRSPSSGLRAANVETRIIPDHGSRHVINVASLNARDFIASRCTLGVRVNFLPACAEFQFIAKFERANFFIQRTSRFLVSKFFRSTPLRLKSRSAKQRFLQALAISESTRSIFGVQVNFLLLQSFGFSCRSGQGVLVLASIHRIFADTASIILRSSCVSTRLLQFLVFKFFTSTSVFDRLKSPSRNSDFCRVGCYAESTTNHLDCFSSIL